MFLGLFGLATGCNGCHEEPTIIIRFEPTDADAKPAMVKPTPMATPTPTPTPTLAGVKHASAKKECKSDAECGVVPEDCCDCANGGKQHALPKSKLAAAKADRAGRCKHVMCTMMFSTDPTCGMRAKCVAGQCELAKKN